PANRRSQLLQGLQGVVHQDEGNGRGFGKGMIPLPEGGRRPLLYRLCQKIVSIEAGADKGNKQSVGHRLPRVGGNAVHQQMTVGDGTDPVSSHPLSNPVTSFLHYAASQANLAPTHPTRPRARRASRATSRSSKS